MTDEELLAEGTRLCLDEQLLPGVRLLRQIQAVDLWKESPQHCEFFRRAHLMEELRANLTASPSDKITSKDDTNTDDNASSIQQNLQKTKWIKQGESHGKRDFVIYYNIQDGGKLKCRIDSVIEASLYVPFLATMNETGLYETWFPRWHFPFRLGLARSEKLKQVGRCEQIVRLGVDLPFPLCQREIVFWGFADEDCEASRTSAARLETVGEGFQNIVEPPEKGAVRMNLDAEFMFRPCPKDHMALKKSKHRYPDGEELILLTFVLHVDPKISWVPHAFMNFCTRTAMGTIWKMILRISEDVRDGKRPEHAALIKSKREELYDWLEERAALISGWRPAKE